MQAAFNEDHAQDALAKMAAIEAKTLRSVRDTAEAKRQWHLVQISNNAFRIAKHHLHEAGYTLYAPQLRTMIKPRTNSLSIAQRKNRHLFAKEQLSPFFGSYRFVRFDANVDPWHDIFKLVGVQGIGVANGMPVAMPEAFVGTLKEREVNGAIPDSTPVRALGFSTGDQVRVNAGSFTGMEGTIERVDENGRIVLLLDLFARLTPAEFTADEVDKVSP